LFREKRRDTHDTTTHTDERRDLMARDIDYAATAVHTAIVDKFGRHSDLQNVEVTAHERTISIHDGAHAAEGTRDDLLAAVRAADSYAKLWEILATRGKTRR
jgi:hypothetical protein